MSPVLHVEGVGNVQAPFVVGQHHTVIHLSRVIVAFHLSFVLFALFGIRTVLVLAFFQSLFYCLVCRSPHLKASLPCAVLTDSGSRFHLSTTLTAEIIWTRKYGNSPPPYWDRRATQPNHIKFRICSALAPMWTPVEDLTQYRKMWFIQQARMDWLYYDITYVQNVYW
jgi:hypothetical protein